MTITDGIMILAVLLAPLVAVQVSVYLERRREKQQRRLGIFRTLMTTRAARLSPAHVEALNMIDIEFSDNNGPERAVLNAWKAYLDHLNTNMETMGAEVWTTRRDDLFVDLLHTMSVVLKYHYDKTHIRRAAYYPQGFGDQEWDQLNIRRGIRELLEGRRSIPVHITGEIGPGDPTDKLHLGSSSSEERKAE